MLYTLEDEGVQWRIAQGARTLFRLDRGDKKFAEQIVKNLNAGLPNVGRALSAIDRDKAAA